MSVLDSRQMYLSLQCLSFIDKEELRLEWYLLMKVEFMKVKNAVLFRKDKKLNEQKKQIIT